MSRRAKDMSALIIADPHARKLALGRVDGEARLPMAALERADGRPAGDERISKTRLGAPQTRAAAFMDAALRAGFERLGMLIARPALDPETDLPSPGLWARLSRHRLEPDREALTYLGRAISPVEAPERAHVRVFAAPLARVTNSLKVRGSMDRLVWLSPEAAERALKGTPVEPFAAMALPALGGRPRPLMVSYRAGRRRIARL